MSGSSTSPSTDEPYQWCIEGPRICNVDPQLMRDFTALVRCNRDGVEYPITADLENVMWQHIIDCHFVCELCEREHGSKEDLDTHVRDDHKVPEPQGADRYIMMDLDRPIGRGECGEVFKAIDLVTKKSVAVKRSIPNRRCKNLSMDEAEILCKLDHPNIIKLLDSYVHDDKHHLVLELMENDLKEIATEPCTLSPADCKSYMQMLLQGLAYLQQNFILHGDLKCDNILIGPDGKLKIADFGLAIYLEDGQARYFKTDISDLTEIVKELIVVESKYQSHEDIYEEFEDCTVESLSKVFPEASEGFLELFEQMFLYQPGRRITPQQALQHRYFTSDPLPTAAHLIPRKTRSAQKI